MTPDGQSLFVGGAQVFCFDLDTGQERWSDTSFGLAVCGQISPNGQYVAVGTMHRNTIQIWDLNTGSKHRRTEGLDATVRAIAFDCRKGDQVC